MYIENVLIQVVIQGPCDKRYTLQGDNGADALLHIGIAHSLRFAKIFLRAVYGWFAVYLMYPGGVSYVAYESPSGILRAEIQHESDVHEADDTSETRCIPCIRLQVHSDILGVYMLLRYTAFPQTYMGFGTKPRYQRFGYICVL